MHLDAVLEFVVEYPLSWSKERRLVYGSMEGEVRWAPPSQPNILLQIKSYIPKQQDLDPEQQIDMSLTEFVGLQITSKELIDLPAGKAWHIVGSTAQEDLRMYLFLRPDRSYRITLATPPDQPDCCEEVMKRVTRSFQTTQL